MMKASTQLFDFHICFSDSWLYGSEARIDLGKSTLDKEVVEKVSCHVLDICIHIHTFILGYLLGNNLSRIGILIFSNVFSQTGCCHFMMWI